MNARKLTLDDIEFSVHATQDVDTPVRGNALASGDDAEDKAVEDEIIRRLDDGDGWAWALVRGEGRFKVDGASARGGSTSIEANDYLGACSYADKEDFCQPGGYFDDMKLAVLAELQTAVNAIVAKVQS